MQKSETNHNKTIKDSQEIKFTVGEGVRLNLESEALWLSRYITCKRKGQLRVLLNLTSLTGNPYYTP